MIGRGTDDRQPECQVDAVVEVQRLERRQRLIMIAAEQRVIAVANAGREQRIGGERAVYDDPFGGKLFDRGSDDADFLIAEPSAFAGMRVEPGDGEGYGRSAARRAGWGRRASSPHWWR